MLTHLDDDGEQRILLADFGIARDIDDISGLTTTNMAVGTVAYSSPEQLMGEEIDGRADEYALAATAYHLLTGSQLFPHSNPAVVISRHLNAAPPVVADTRLELGALDPVVAVALAKNPDDRFPRCSDFARALAEQSSVHGSPSPVAPTKPAQVPPGSRPDASQAPATAEPPHRAEMSDQEWSRHFAPMPPPVVSAPAPPEVVEWPAETVAVEPERPVAPPARSRWVLQGAALFVIGLAMLVSGVAFKATMIGSFPILSVLGFLVIIICGPFVVVRTLRRSR